MELIINNFRKIEKADLEINTVTLVAGQNEAGKTSLAQAAQAVATGNLNVLGVTKKDAMKLVRDGSKAGSVWLRHDKENGTHAIWPSMEISAKGKQLSSSAIAAGVVKFSHLKKDEAAKILADVLKAHPTEEDFMAVAVPLIGEKLAPKIWGMIEQQGWDSAYNEILDNARDLKAQWKSITHEQWGDKKAVGWMPQDYSADMESGDAEAHFVGALADAKRLLEEAVATNAVVDDRVARLKADAAPYPELVAAKKLLEASIPELEVALAKAEAELQESPPVQATPIFCPHCGGGVVLVMGKLEQADSVSEDDRKAMAAARQTKQFEVNDLRNRLQRERGELSRVQEKGKRAVEAAKALKEIGDVDAPAQSDNTDKLASFRADVATAERSLVAYRQYIEAAKTHARIERAMSIAKEVAPNGLRQRKAGEAVERFNTEILQPLCQSFGIAPISVDLDMNILYRTHAYPFLSESAKFRVDAVLQTAFAKLDGSDLIILDGADIVVGKDRTGLVKMLAESGIPSLLFMALSKPEATPSLANIGGAVYWIENSVATKLEK